MLLRNKKNIFSYRKDCDGKNGDPRDPNGIFVIKIN